MRILVLGGSWFLGKAVVDVALATGREVAVFRRGQTGIDTPGVNLVRGDRTNRADLSRLAAEGPWDLVVDTISYIPRDTLAMARALEPVAAKYVLVSSVSVYEGWPIEPLAEDSAVLECPSDADADFGFDGDPGPTKYGFGKAGCERAVQEVFGVGRAVALRPGVILGPREYVGRLAWWLRRMERGGRVLAPGNPDRRIQPVDVRDVAAFAMHAATGLHGPYNLTAQGQDTMGGLLDACREVTSSVAELEWVTDENWLVAQGIQQWTELPLWRTYPGAWEVDSTRAHDAGFASRPVRQTVADTWAWLQSGVAPIDHERASELGITPDREQAVLDLWDAYRLNHSGIN